MSFWFENWSGLGLLGSLVPFVNVSDLDLRVRDVCAWGTVNFHMLHSMFPSALRDSLSSVAVCINDDVPDLFTWQYNLHGIYSVKDGYQWLRRNAVGSFSSDDWNWIWRLEIPEKVRLFVKQCCHDSLPTSVTWLTDVILLWTFVAAGACIRKRLCTVCMTARL